MLHISLKRPSTTIDRLHTALKKPVATRERDSIVHTTIKRPKIVSLNNPKKASYHLVLSVVCYHPGQGRPDTTLEQPVTITREA